MIASEGGPLRRIACIALPCLGACPSVPHASDPGPSDRVPADSMDVLREARPVLGLGAAAAAALLAALSPALVYYSRYYIHEVPLVAASFLALVGLCRYLQRPRPAWALLAGVAAGLMLECKHTAARCAGRFDVAPARAR